MAFSLLLLGGFGILLEVVGGDGETLFAGQP